MLPTGNTGKKYIKEVTRLLNAWTQDTPLNSISLKAIHTMPALKTIWMPSKEDYSYWKEMKLNLYYWKLKPFNRDYQWCNTS